LERLGELTFLYGQIIPASRLAGKCIRRRANGDGPSSIVVARKGCGAFAKFSSQSLILAESRRIIPSQPLIDVGRRRLRPAQNRILRAIEPALESRRAIKFSGSINGALIVERGLQPCKFLVACRLRH